MVEFKYDDDTGWTEMSTEERPSDFHSQDWIFVIEALAHWAGEPNDAISGRRGRAYDLIDAIAADEGLSADELVLQSVEAWPTN